MAARQNLGVGGLYIGFVHCGGAFHTPTHYGTNVHLMVSVLHVCTYK